MTIDSTETKKPQLSPPKAAAFSRQTAQWNSLLSIQMQTQAPTTEMTKELKLPVA